MKNSDELYTKCEKRVYLSACWVFNVHRNELEISRDHFWFFRLEQIFGAERKVLKVCDAEVSVECHKLAVCFRSEARSCSRYLEIGFKRLKKVKITQVTCSHGKNLGDRNVYNDRVITGDYCSKSDSKEEDRGSGTVAGGAGGPWVFLGWVCAAQDSKLAPRSKKNFP